MTVTALLVFAVVALVTIATPGPTVLLALTNGTRYGVRRSLPGMLGAVVSDLVLVALLRWAWERCWQRPSSGSRCSSGLVRFT